MEHRIEHIAVLGAGTMGSGIAQFFAAAGYDVALYSRTEKTLSRSLEMISASLAALAEVRGEDAVRPERAMERIHTFTDLPAAAAGADWVIETVSENKDVKKQVIEQADKYAPEGAWITSDTSALNIFTFLQTGRPDRVMISHFFNPAGLMPLVELVAGPETAPETVQGLRSFLEAAGKKPIVLKTCIPGFVANRLTLALAREAYYLAGEGYASIEDIDRVITTTFGPRYVFEGIFDLYDHIGLDVGCSVAEGLLPELCSSVEVPRLLREKVEAGELGVKTGKGLKDYTGQDVGKICSERSRKIAESFQFIEKL